MTDALSKQFTAESYPHLGWTVEEEDAFNRIPGHESSPPTLRSIFIRKSRSVLAALDRYIDNHPYHFHF